MVLSEKLPLPSSFHIQSSMPGEVPAQLATLSLMNYHRHINNFFNILYKVAHKLSTISCDYWAVENKISRGICSKFLLWQCISIQPIFPLLANSSFILPVYQSVSLVFCKNNKLSSNTEMCLFLFFCLVINIWLGITIQWWLAWKAFCIGGWPLLTETFLILHPECWY